jgi:hypothetical protein
MGSKMLRLRDNRPKILPAAKGVGWNFLMKRTKIKRAMYNLQKLSKFRPPVQCTDNPIKSKEFRS